IPSGDPKCVRSPRLVAGDRGAGAWRVWTERLDAAPGAEELFDRLYGNAETAVWLDSAQQMYGMGRFSIMGEPDEVLSFEDPPWDEIEALLAAPPVDPMPGLPFCGGYVGSVSYETKTIGCASSGVVA